MEEIQNETQISSEQYAEPAEAENSADVNDEQFMPEAYNPQEGVVMTDKDDERFHEIDDEHFDDSENLYFPFRESSVPEDAAGDEAYEEFSDMMLSFFSEFVSLLPLDIQDYARNADLVIYVVDSSKNLDENDEKIMDLICDKRTIILLNKSDLDMIVTEDVMREKMRETAVRNGKNAEDVPILVISARDESGISEFEETVKRMFIKGDISFNDEIYITNARQKSALQDAAESMRKVVDSVDAGMPEDFYSIDLMDAYESLGNITGESMGEDLINEIFSKFCMGK